ncbi:MAG TPA: histidine kinase, partial [Spirochaetia bacterium]|nr:histidine kinase [Spirochaetia bacterium]
LLGGAAGERAPVGEDLDYVYQLLPRLGGVDSKVAISEAAGRLAESIDAYREARAAADGAAAAGAAADGPAADGTGGAAGGEGEAEAAERARTELAASIESFLRVLHARGSEVRASFNYLLLASGVGIAAVAVYAVWLWSRLRESGLRDEWSRRSLRHALEAEDAARRRIARDLHDDAAQDIAAAKMLCDRAAACTEAAAGAAVRAEASAPGVDASGEGAGASCVAGERAEAAPGAEAARLAGEASALLRGAGLKLRSLAMELRPPELEGGGLVDALASLCSSGRRGEAIVLHVGEDLPGIAPEAALHAYRVAQEGLANAAKHAKGNRIELRLERAFEGGRAWLVLEVLDSAEPTGAVRAPGPSAAADDPSLSSGTGLSIMRERAALAGGRLDFERRADGAILRLSVPGLAPGKEGT